jgi:DNA-binding response OmpR family regulator
MRDQPRQGKGEVSTMAHTAARPSVLIVDEDPQDVQLLQRALWRQGYSAVTTAHSAGEALLQLEATGERGTPQALVVSLSLLVRDGYALLQRVRESPRWAGLPVLVLVARYPATTIRTAAGQGATAFITPPFSGRELTYKIEQAVQEAGPRAAELSDLREPDPRPGP